MQSIAIAVLRVVLVTAGIGTVVFQTVMVPLIGMDLDEVGADAQRLPVMLVLVLGMVTVQVVLVCTWRLADLAHRGAFFTPPMFRWVDRITWSVGAAAVLLLVLGAVLSPGEAVPPGLVLLLGGAALLVGGLGIVVVVLRTLLAQAVARDVEATMLQAELDEVI